MLIYEIAAEFPSQIDLRTVLSSLCLSPFSVLRPFGSAPWTANAPRLCNIQLAMRAVSSACNRDVTKNRQCAHPGRDITPLAAQMFRFGGDIRFLPFQNETEPQCPPCGRPIAAPLSCVPALLLGIQMQSCPFKIEGGGIIDTV